jgi:DNA-binding FadR family transcriptional regulator
MGIVVTGRSIETPGSAGDGLRPVERKTLAPAVMERIVSYIHSKPLAAGDPLPAQPSLARQLGVSRPVLREALQGLAALGVVEILAGSGVYVLDPEAVAEKDGLAEIATHEAALEALEARMVLEVGMAGLAAERATDEDFARMDQSLEQLPAGGRRRRSPPTSTGRWPGPRITARSTGSPRC